MKKLILFLLLVPGISLSYDYDIKDSKGNKQFEIKDSVIRDNRWNKIGTIDKDGYVRDTRGNRTGVKFEKKRK